MMNRSEENRLNTIRFYIILKLTILINIVLVCLNTIRFYIILKLLFHHLHQCIVWILYVFTSFSNMNCLYNTQCEFEYYTFLHHSQTRSRNDTEPCDGLNTIRFYIILKPKICSISSHDSLNTIRFYIILKPPPVPSHFRESLNTIRFYIILKLGVNNLLCKPCLNTIRFYIILKQTLCIPQVYGSLNTIRFYIILKPQIQKWNASHAHTL